MLRYDKLLKFYYIKKYSPGTHENRQKLLIILLSVSTSKIYIFMLFIFYKINFIYD